MVNMEKMDAPWGLLKRCAESHPLQEWGPHSILDDWDWRRGSWTCRSWSFWGKFFQNQESKIFIIGVRALIFGPSRWNWILGRFDWSKIFTETDSFRDISVLKLETSRNCPAGLGTSRNCLAGLGSSRNCPEGLGNIQKLPRRVRNVQKLPRRVSVEE